MTVTGTTRPASSKICVIPIFLPRIALGISLHLLRIEHAGARSQPDLDVDARREVEPHQGVHRLGRRVQDVDKTLVDAHLELLPGVLVNVRRTQHRKQRPLRRKWDRPRHPGAGALGRLHDALSGTVQKLVVKRLQPNTNLLRHKSFSGLLLPLWAARAQTEIPPRGGAPREQPPASSPKIVSLSRESSSRRRRRRYGRLHARRSAALPPAQWA